MSLYQVPPPPPLANFSFPPLDKDQLHFNYIDSFVTTWVTLEGSKDSCYLQLFYWNSSAPNEGWTRSTLPHTPFLSQHKFQQSIRVQVIIMINRTQSDRFPEWHQDPALEGDHLGWPWPVEPGLCGPTRWRLEDRRSGLPSQS